MTTDANRHDSESPKPQQPGETTPRSSQRSPKRKLATKSNRHKKKARTRAPRRQSLDIEPLEDRILLSATWIDADTGDGISDATTGNDIFTGTAGDDVANGLAGNDQLHGQEGDDSLFGDLGDDILAGDSGDDLLDGGSGTDTADYSNSTDAVNVDLTLDGQSQTISASQGSDTLTSIESVIGSAQNDTFAFSQPTASDAFTVDGGGGSSNVIDLSGFDRSDATIAADSITIDMGNGDSFTIAHSNIQTIDFDDASFDVASMNSGPDAIDDAVTTNEDTPITTANVLTNDIDADGDTLTVSSFTQPSNGTVVNNGDGTFTYTPDTNYNGSDSFTYTVSDGNGGTDTATINLTVNAVNDGPVAGADSFTTNEDTAITTGNVLANDTDVEGDTLTVDSFTQPTNGTVVYNNDGTFTFTPDANYNGSDSFTYTVTDSNGGTDTATINLTVNAVNDGPVAGAESFTTNEDTAITTGNVLTNDTDVEGDTLTVSSFTQPSNGTVVNNGDGTFTYTPDANFNGSDSFTYTVSDGNGGTDTATISLTVNAVNDDPLSSDFAVNTSEDVALTTADVLASASDVDGDTLTVDSFTQPTNGTVTYNGDGTFSYTPDADYNGSDSFTYTVSDGNGGTDTSTITISVASVEDAPRPGDDAITTSEDVAVTTGNILANDSDPDGDAIAMYGFTQPANGTVAYNGDGTFTYTPDGDYNGVETFTYTIGDSNGNTGTATITINVTAVNDDPEAKYDRFSLSEDVTLTTGNVFVNDTDLDGDTLSVGSFTQPAHGTVTYNGDGTFDYTTDLHYNGDDVFTYTLSDGSGGTDTVNVFIVANAVNDAPDAFSDTATTNEDTSVVTGNVLTNDTDIDADTLSVDSFTQPSNGTVSNNDDGTFTYTPDAGFNGTDSFTYVVMDGNGGSDTGTVTVTVNAVNDNPDAEDDAGATLVEDGTATTINVLTNDADVDGDTLTVGSFTQPTHGSVTSNGDGTFDYTPDANYNGSDSFTYTSSDGNGGTATATVNLLVTAVNDDPTPNSDSVSTESDTPITTGNVLTNDIDIDGDVLAVHSFAQPTHGSVSYNGNGTFTYTPDTGYAGGDSFTYTVTDGHGATATATVAVTVNDDPNAVNDSATTGIDSAVTTGDVLANDGDPNADTLTITGFSQPSNGSVANNGDGTFTYTPGSGFHGTDSFTYTVSDGNGGTDVATVNLTVNTSSSAAADTATTTEDAVVTTGNVLTNDADADGDTLTVETFTQPANGTVTYNGDGTFDYTPDANFNGTDTFTYTVDDGFGGESTATVTVTVSAVQDAPDAINDSYATPTDAAVTTGNVLANDTDVDGDTLSLSAFTQPANGSVVDNADGTFTYTPDGGYHGNDSFTYTISDGNGGTDTATITITVNDDASAVGDSATTNEDSAVTTVDVLANDSDPNSDTLSVASYTQPTSGSANYNNDGTFTYTPDADFNGSDSFTYTIDDGYGGKSTATISLTVVPVADNPDATDDTVSTYENTVVTTDVLANDTDVDGDTISVASFTQPTHGSVVDNGDGTFTYTPDTDYIGSDSYTYTINDGTGRSATGTVNISVNDPNVAPTVVTDNVAVTEDVVITTGNVLANDSDSDGDTLSIGSFTQPTHGNVVSNGDGTFTYTPDANYNGSDSFTYTAIDGEGGSTTGTVNLTIASVNDSPVVVLDVETTDEDTAFTTGNVLTNDTDVEGNPLAVYSYTQPSSGSVTYNNDGTFTYTPDANANGADSFTYTITDAHGGTSTGTVQITVNAVNDAPDLEVDVVATNEDNAVTITSPLANDSDVEGDTLTISSFTQPSNGAVVDNGDGTYTYTPDANYNGSDSFTYTVTDGNGGTSTGTVTINVASVNDAPITVDDTLVADEDTTITSASVLTNDSDVEGHTIAVRSFTQPANGSVSYNGDGTFTYRGSKDYNGPDSFTYTIGDGRGTSTTGTVNITVNAVNDDPKAFEDEFTASEDTPFTTGDVLANDTDVDPDTHTIQSFTQPANGTVSSNGDGTFDYTPDANYHGTETFSYVVSDGAGGTATSTVTINVQSVNDIPIANSDTLTLNEDTSATTGNVLSNDTDLDNDTLAVASYSQPANGTVTYNEDGTFTYTPTADYFGADTFTYIVVDGNGGTDTGVVNVTVSNVSDDAVAVNDYASTAEDNAVTTGNVLSNDYDVDGDTLTITSFSQPSNGTVISNGDGTFTYTPDANYNGTDSFTYVIEDGAGTSDTGVVTISVWSVNDGPDAVDDTYSTNEDTMLTMHVYSNDSDIDNDSLSVDSYTQPTHGTITYHGYGQFRYTPSSDYNGSDSFTYTVRDGNGGFDTATVNLTIDAVNDAPDTVGDSVTTNEDASVTTGNVLANDSDVEGDSITLASYTQPSNGSVSYNNDGTFTYTPDANYNGADTFTYTVNDGNGGSTTETVSVTVASVNDGPVAVAESFTTNEDTAITTGNVLANDTDIEGDTLTVDSFTQPTNGTVVYNNDGTFTFTPDANYNGSDSFTYTMTDSNGGTDTATINLTVNAVNDGPVAVAESFTTNEDTAITTGNVLANDTDVEGDTLTVDSFTQPSNGTVVYNNDGTFTFTPDANYNGSDSFTYTVTDSNGGTDTATITLTVNAVNDGPVAVAESFTTNEDTAITTGNVLANDTDVEGDTLTVDSFTQPTNGTVVYNNDGTFTFTPGANYNGSDSFTYTVTDSNGGTDTATINLTVNAVNDGPVAVAESFTTNEDTAITTGNVLANDTDVEGDTLTVDSFTQPSNGTVVYNNDGTFTFTPGANYNGNDSFTYTVTDSNGGTDTATINLTVNAVNDGPVAVAESFTTNEDTAITTGNVLANDTDVEGDTLTVDSFTQPSNGTVVYNNDGTFTFTPGANYNGSDSFTYTVTDSNGGTDTATINLTVNAVNDGPAAVAESFTTNEDTAITTGNVLANDTDVEGDTLTVDSFTQPTNGTVVYNNDGTFTFTPDANYNGSDAFTYTVTDSNGGTDTATINLTVNAVNDGPAAAADSFTTNEDTAITTGNVLANDTDIEGDTLTVDSFTQPTNGTVVYNNDGTFTFTPDANYNGSDSFTYTVTDSNGGTDTATISLTVNAVNDGPVAVAESFTTNEDTAITTGNVLANDTDIEGDTLTVDSFTQPTNGTVVYNNDGTFTFTPDANYNGSDSFTYTVTDSNGGTDTATISLTVNAVNDGPLSSDLTVSTHEDVSVTTTNVLASASDVDGDTLTVDSFTQPSNGSVVYNGDGTFTFTPDANYNGSDAFTYTVSDSNGGTDTATINLTVNAVNNGPVAIAESFSTTEDTAITTGNVLANDTDIENDTLTVDSFTQPTNGTVVYNNDGTFTFTPDTNYNGSDAFTYTVSDGNGGTDTATINLTVNAVNDGPVAVAESFTTNEDTAITTGNVLANDTDVEGDTLTVDSFTQPTNGTVVYNNDGTFTYTPDANYNGSDSFTYTVTDSNGGTDTATISLTVDTVNDGPIAVDDIIDTDQHIPVTFDPLLNDSDIESTNLQAINVQTSEHASVSINNDGTLTYTPAGGFAGTDQFTYTIVDEDGGTSTATVEVEVRPAPELEPEDSDSNDEADTAETEDASPLIWDGSEELEVLDPTSNVDESGSQDRQTDSLFVVDGDESADSAIDFTIEQSDLELVDVADLAALADSAEEIVQELNAEWLTTLGSSDFATEFETVPFVDADDTFDRLEFESDDRAADTAPQNLSDAARPQAAFAPWLWALVRGAVGSIRNPDVEHSNAANEAKSAKETVKKDRSR